jgi:hypothetical protein
MYDSLLYRILPALDHHVWEIFHVLQTQTTADYWRILPTLDLHVWNTTMSSYLNVNFIVKIKIHPNSPRVLFNCLALNLDWYSTATVYIASSMLILVMTIRMWLKSLIWGLCTGQRCSFTVGVIPWLLANDNRFLNSKNNLVKNFLVVYISD